MSLGVYAKVETFHKWILTNAEFKGDSGSNKMAAFNYFPVVVFSLVMKRLTSL